MSVFLQIHKRKMSLRLLLWLFLKTPTVRSFSSLCEPHFKCCFKSWSTELYLGQACREVWCRIFLYSIARIRKHYCRIKKLKKAFQSSRQQPPTEFCIKGRSKRCCLFMLCIPRERFPMKEHSFLHQWLMSPLEVVKFKKLKSPPITGLTGWWTLSAFRWRWSVKSEIPWGDLSCAKLCVGTLSPDSRGVCRWLNRWEKVVKWRR